MEFLFILQTNNDKCDKLVVNTVKELPLCILMVQCFL